MDPFLGIWLLHTRRRLGACYGVCIDLSRSRTRGAAGCGRGYLIARDEQQRVGRNVVPHVPWRGGAEYDVDPYRALVDGGRAQRMLGWKPQYRWDG